MGLKEAAAPVCATAPGRNLPRTCHPGGGRRLLRRQLLRTAGAGALVQRGTPLLALRQRHGHQRRRLLLRLCQPAVQHEAAAAGSQGGPGEGEQPLAALHAQLIQPAQEKGRRASQVWVQEHRMRCRRGAVRRPGAPGSAKAERPLASTQPTRTQGRGRPLPTHPPGAGGQAQQAAAVAHAQPRVLRQQKGLVVQAQAAQRGRQPAAVEG